MSRAIPTPLDIAGLPTNYEFFLAALGFERRARHIAETIQPQARRLIALGFQDRHELNYAENSKWFTEHQYEVSDIASDAEFVESLKSILTNTSKEIDVIGCVDISSLTRSRMAAIVELCCTGHVRDGASIDFLYSLGAYSPPPDEVAPNTLFSPISPFFAGWTTNANKPPVAIVGLGYEEGKALGATEYIQADEAWAFIPESPIDAYSPAVLDANATLLQFLPPRQQIVYRADDPVGCYLSLESLLYGVVPFGRPVILPFGPKIFSLVALLACTKYSEASVWRVSAQQNEVPIDRLPSDHVIGVRVTFHHQLV